MKNVTKILTAVVLCAAIFASTQRTDALGGNPAFWPGDEANISAFPAQINNHGFLQVTNMGNGNVPCVDDNDLAVVGGCPAKASVGMVFSSGTNNWSLGYSDDGSDWFSLGWGNNNGMGINIGMVASDNNDFVTSNGFRLSVGKDLGDNGEIGFHYISGKTETKVEAVCSSGTAGTADDCAAEDDFDAGHTWSAATTADYTWDSNGDGAVDSCTGGTGADQTACEADGGTWGGFNAETFTCTGGTAVEEAACLVEDDTADDCSSGNTTDQAACLAEGDTEGGHTWVLAHADPSDWNTADNHNGMTLNYRKSCGFWVFTDMVVSLEMPDGDDTGAGYNEGEMMLDVDMFGHMDAGAADVMFAMGIAYNAKGGTLAQTAAIGVEAAVTDNVTVRGGMNWSYDLSNDAGTTGATSEGYGWTTGAGVNFGSFTADLTLGETFYSNPFGFLSGNDDDSTWGNITATYNF